MKQVTILSKQPILSKQLQENEFTIPIKYEPKLLVRNSYYKRYELQKLILLLVSKN